MTTRKIEWKDVKPGMKVLLPVVSVAANSIGNIIIIVQGADNFQGFLTMCPTLPPITKAEIVEE